MQRDAIHMHPLSSRLSRDTSPTVGIERARTIPLRERLSATRCAFRVCDDVAMHREGTPAVNGLCSSPRPSIPSSSQKTPGCGFFGSSISTTTVARRT